VAIANATVSSHFQPKGVREARADHFTVKGNRHHAGDRLREHWLERNSPDQERQQVDGGTGVGRSQIGADASRIP
jgi:hypothetical protein